MIRPWISSSLVSSGLCLLNASCHHAYFSTLDRSANTLSSRSQYPWVDLKVSTPCNASNEPVFSLVVDFENASSEWSKESERYPSVVSQDVVFDHFDEHVGSTMMTISKCRFYGGNEELQRACSGDR